MAEFTNFTSLPPQEEALFVVYEEKSVGNSRSARNIALGIAIPLFFLIIVNYLTNRTAGKCHVCDQAGGEETVRGAELDGGLLGEASEEVGDGDPGFPDGDEGGVEAGV